MKIIVEKTLHPSWDDYGDGHSDQDIIDFLDDATWTVVRERKGNGE